jgi:hypothetical protein
VSVREWRAISGVSGVPIASDLGKGVYYVDQTCAVLYWAPGQEAVVVAPRVADFAKFRPVEINGGTPDRA